MFDLPFPVSYHCFRDANVNKSVMIFNEIGWKNIFSFNQQAVRYGYISMKPQKRINCRSLFDKNGMGCKPVLAGDGTGIRWRHT
jgi:hypothetical protein